jgi:murein DD-endopeptidase MepM/ murein hydrolase activator NlpD
MKKVILFTFVWLISCSLATQAFGKKKTRVKHVQQREIAAADNIQRQINALNSLMLQKMQQEEDPYATEEDTEMPAAGVYETWTNSRINPYQTPYYKLPDSVKIDLSQYVPPVETYITSPFGMRRYRFHYGTDLKLNVGDPVRCAFDGKVRITGYEAKGYGNYVVVRHSNGLETVYGHLSKILVSENQQMKAGEMLGLGGSTGRSTGPHLHFETRYLGNAINPAKLFDFTYHTPYNDQYVITKHGSFDYQFGKVPASSAYKKYVARKGKKSTSKRHRH